MILFLKVAESNPTSSSNNNTALLIGVVVAAVVVLVTVVLIVACVLYPRSHRRENAREIINLQNEASGDIQPTRRMHVGDGERPTEYAQLSVFMKVPVDTNNQSLKTEDQMQPKQNEYENTASRLPEENQYEEMH